MQLKISPIVNTRYWVAILVASTCGTNLGDMIPKMLGLGTASGLLLCAVLFALLMFVDRITEQGSELFYWVVILIVRAAATDIADSLVDKTPLGEMGAIVVLSVVLLALLVLIVRSRRTANGGGSEAMPAVNGMYWLTMLAAGALGTVIGDTVGHALGPHHTGLPVSELIASLVFLLVLGVRMLRPDVVVYWLAIVAVRWWGTNMGDIFAHRYSLSSSGIVSLVVLFAILIAWRTPSTSRSLGNA